MTIHWARHVATALFVLASAAPAPAQDYPLRPVMLITSTPPGNGPDVIARIVADGLSRLWKQPVVVENRPGGRCASSSKRSFKQCRAKETAQR